MWPSFVWPSFGWPSLGGPALGGPALGGPALGGPALGGHLWVAQLWVAIFGWPSFGWPSLGGPALGGPALGGPALGGPALGGPAVKQLAENAVIEMCPQPPLHLQATDESIFHDRHLGSQPPPPAPSVCRIQRIIGRHATFPSDIIIMCQNTNCGNAISSS